MVETVKSSFSEFVIGSWKIDLSTENILISGNIASFFEIDSRELSYNRLKEFVEGDKEIISVFRGNASQRCGSHTFYIRYDKRLFFVELSFEDPNSGFVRFERMERKQDGVSIANDLFQQTPIGLELFDAQGSLLAINQKAIEIFGVIDREQMRSFNLFNDEGYPDSFRQGLNDGRKVSMSFKYDFEKAKERFKTSKKGQKHIISKGVPVYDSNGVLKNYIVAHSDDEEAYKTRSTMKDFESVFSAISGIAHIGYCKWDILAKVGFAMDQWYENMGVPAGSDIEKTVLNVNNIHPDDYEDIESTYLKFSTGEINSVHREVRIKDPNTDQYKWILMSVITTKFDPKHNSVEVMGVSIDITAHKQAQIRLQEISHQVDQLIEKSEIVTNNLSTALIHIDANHVVRWATTSFNSLYQNMNYVPGEVCYKTAFGRDTPCENCPFDMMIKNGVQSVKHVDIDGCTVEVTANPAQDKNGNVIGGIIRLEDITKRKQDERRIKELNHLMEAILDYTPVMIFVKDPNDDFRYLYWNKGMADVIGVPPNKAIGNIDKDVFPRMKDAERFRNDDIAILEKGETVEFEEEFYDANGNIKYVSTVKTLIPTEQEKPWLLGVSWDITSNKIYQKELIKAKEIAEENDKFKSSFVANMSHEIRTPLNAIVGFSELLIDSRLDDQDRAEYLTIIRKNNQLLLQLVADILDLSRIEAKMLEFNYEKVNINTLGRRMARSFNMRTDISVPVVFDDNTPEYFVLTDENRVQQIITNFVTNALKFTHKGEVKIVYKLISDDRVEISVVDTGTGIHKEKQKSVFDRFVKLDSCVQGTGLGLAICKNLTEQLGGEIGMESEWGVGSRFWFTLPYDKNL